MPALSHDFTLVQVTVRSGPSRPPGAAPRLSGRRVQAPLEHVPFLRNRDMPQAHALAHVLFGEAGFTSPGHALAEGPWRRSGRSSWSAEASRVSPPLPPFIGRDWRRNWWSASKAGAPW